MFQQFANYLLGSLTNQEQAATVEGVEKVSGDSNVKLSWVDQEDEWVLVDRDSDSNSDACSVVSLGDPEECRDLLHPVIRTRTSSTSSSSAAAGRGTLGRDMEESWFVTPPPCFTSTGPVHVETSPLENLLIEHPSMSVYHYIHPCRRHYTTAVPFISSPVQVRVGSASRSPSPAQRPRSDGEDSEVELEVDERAVVNRPQPHLNRLHVLQQQDRQNVLNKRAQKIQVQKACKALKHGHMERNNKAREINGRNRRQRRGERSQGATRSFANNNRKC